MDVGRRIFDKVAARVVWPLTALIILSSIDRVNISFAALQMNSAIGLDAAAYGFGASLFFLGYLLMQLPSATVLRRIGARRWIGISVIGWGLAATAMAFIRTRDQYYALRLILGGFESGFAPGVVWYVSRWLPPLYRSRSVGATLLAIPISVVIGGPLCGALLSLDGGTFGGWRLMFFVEGVATVAAGVAALWWFVDRPDEAAWLDPAEQAWIEQNVAAEPAGGGGAFSAALRDPRLIHCALLWFALVTGANAIIFWLPLALRAFGLKDPLAIGLLSALPWLAIGAGMWLNGSHSDRHGERRLHIAIGAALGAAGFGLAAAAGGGALAMALLVLGGLGLGGAQSVFWSVPTDLALGRSPQAIAAINLVGNLSGILAPGAIGWAVARYGSMTVPIYAIAGLLLIAALLAAMLPRHSGRGDRSRGDRSRGDNGTGNIDRIVDNPGGTA